MKSPAEVEKLVKKFRIKPTVRMREKTLTDALKAQEEIKKTESAVTRPNIWRIIMKTKLKKLTAASIAFACLLPLCYGVGKLVTTFIIVDEGVVTYPNEENNGGDTYGWKVGVKTIGPGRHGHHGHGQSHNTQRHNRPDASETCDSHGTLLSRS